uniref:Uncharacterized protein n=2 Tax=Phaeomonas parva TaxID=124430 RepID=A0A7S1XSY4_9STRA|mmetsp:Transcript_34190/g.107815  ORF Transcript_34190/g.107815 Transcript_34190/m.107815 type:complete len:139 (+) Transcript_34190:657-1073(+)
MSCQQWHAPVDGVLADVQGVSDGSVFVMPLDDARRLGGLVSEADLEETQVVVLSGHGIFEDEVVPRRAGRGRRLDDSGNSTEGYTQEEIDEFQVNLWTAVFLILLTLGAVMALVTMHVIPDSLLYAKFQADVSGFKDD